MLRTLPALLFPLLVGAQPEPVDLNMVHRVPASRPRELAFPSEPVGRRYTLVELSDLSTGALAAIGRGGPAPAPALTPGQLRISRARLQTYFRGEQPAVVVRIGPRRRRHDLRRGRRP